MRNLTLLTDLYELTMKKRTQTGIVACASIDDYLNNIIKKHENTREDKEIDRIRHVDTCSAQTGPIFLAYRSNPSLNAIISQEKTKIPLYLKQMFLNLLLNKY